MTLPSAVHVSSTFVFGAMLHDCLSVDPLVQSSILHFFSEPHESHRLALFMCPPPSSLEPRECDCLPLFANSPFSTFIRSPMNVIAKRCSFILNPKSLELSFLIA